MDLRFWQKKGSPGKKRLRKGKTGGKIMLNGKNAFQGKQEILENQLIVDLFKSLT